MPHCPQECLSVVVSRTPQQVSGNLLPYFHVCKLSLSSTGQGSFGKDPLLLPWATLLTKAFLALNPVCQNLTYCLLGAWTCWSLVRKKPIDVKKKGQFRVFVYTLIRIWWETDDNICLKISWCLMSQGHLIFRQNTYFQIVSGCFHHQ